MRNISSGIMLLPFYAVKDDVFVDFFSSLKGIICYVSFTSRLFNGLQAVFVGDAFGPERFEFLLDTVLRLQQHAHVPL